MQITLEDGTTQEVFTQEELQAQRDAAVEEFKQSNPDRSEEITLLQEELEKFKTKDLNFGNLRAQKEDLERKLKDITADVDTKIGTVKKEILEGVVKDHYNQLLESLAGTDSELKKKIEFHYKRLADPTATKEDVTKKITDAWALATRVENQGALNTAVISSSGVGRLTARGSSTFTPEEKAFAQKLAKAGGINLEDKDFNK